MSTANRKYKDSVFVDLFSEDEKAKENFLSLYNALHGTELKDTKQLKNVRLDQVLYMSFYNDVSYLIENKIIVLAEHQSTINPNMPLRCLEYVSRLYETLFESKEKYSRKLLSIPTPEFYVFYNGTEEYPETTVLKLSDAFVEKAGEVNLELTVKVININQHDKYPILANCQTMKEYSIFVETVRKWKEIDQINGFEKAIEECIANNILKEYLKRKTKEVLNMLLAEYDYETDIAVQRAEEREIAFAQGMSKGISQGIQQGIQQGISQGIQQGISQGISQGAYQKALETAKNLTEMGFAVEAISKATGLSLEEVAHL